MNDVKITVKKLKQLVREAVEGEESGVDEDDGKDALRALIDLVEQAADEAESLGVAEETVNKLWSVRADLNVALTED